jgi:hypothetical protein
MSLAKTPALRCKACHTPSTGNVGNRCGVQRYGIFCTGELEAPRYKVVDLKSNKFQTYDGINTLTPIEAYAAIVHYEDLGLFLTRCYGHPDPRVVATRCTVLLQPS